jgi:hypothetical protein
MIAWVARQAWLAVREVIGAVRTANDQRMCMWECFLLSSRAVPM